VADAHSRSIFVFDGRGTNEALLEVKIHPKHAVCAMGYNSAYNTVISLDVAGNFEYWSPDTGKVRAQGPDEAYAVRMTGNVQFPDIGLEFQYKSDTNLFEMAKAKSTAGSIAVSNSGKMFAVFGTDGCVSPW
jgi:peptidylprolyl isomerase domain and WD repeat-containing protein 1